MIATTKAQRQRLIIAHRIEMADNVFRVDFAPKPVVSTPPVHRLPIFLDVAGGVFVLVVLLLATLGLLYLPGAH